MKKLEDINLREEERIIKVVYHHAVIIIPHLIISFLSLILNFFLMYYLFLQGWWGVLLFLLIIFFVVFYVFRLIFLYKKNKFVVTNQRIIDFEQVGFFERFVNEFPYKKVRNAKAVMKGIGPTLFRYGNLKLELKNDLGPFELYKVGDPINLQNKINEFVHKKEEVETKDCADVISMIMDEVKYLNKQQKEEVVNRIQEQLQVE
jgi:hypothetical protein